MRDFSAINIDTLPLANVPTKTGVQELIEEDEEEVVSIQTVKSSTINSSQPAILPAQGIRRKSMTAVIVASHDDESKSLGVDQATLDTNEEHKNMTALTEKLRIMEAELAIVKAQLVTSQQAHEQSLEELKAERVARERAQGVIQFMTAETKFLLQDATHTAASKAAQTSAQHDHESAMKYLHTDEDAVSSTSGRSIRSVYSANVKTRNPPVTSRPAARGGYAAPTKTREPYQRPNTTMGTYGSTPAATSSSRPTSRQAFNSSTSSTRPANVTNKVLVSSNIHNVVNQQPTGASLLAKKKSRPNLSENVKPSTIKAQQTGGAIRAVPRDRNLDGGLYGKR